MSRIGSAALDAYRGNPLLDDILQTLPGLPEALAVDAAADRAIRDAAAADLAIPESDRLEEVLASGVLDTSVIDDLAAARVRTTDAKVKIEILEHLRITANRHIDSALANSSGILEALHGRLCDLVDQALPHAEKLAGITTANAAIDAGTDTVTAWSALADTRKDYDAIRTAQDTVMGHAELHTWNTARRLGNDLPTEASDARIANLDDLWPTWRASASTGGEAGRVDPRGVVRRELISGTRLNGHPWPDDPTAELAWLITHAELWVPTRSQLDTLWAQRKDRDFERARELHLAAKANGTVRTGDRLTGAVAKPY